MTTSPNVASMQPILSKRYALGWKGLLATAVFCLWFMYLNYIHLFHSDIWGHVHYGKWMLENGRLVDEDPFMPLAVGMHAVNNAWLSQLLFAKAFALGGPEYLSAIFALTGLATFLVHFRVIHLFTGRTLTALGGCGLLLFVGWSRHAIIRPEIFGNLLFGVLLWMIVRLEPWRSRAFAFNDASHEPNADNAASCPRWMWLAMPALFALWANTHGSFAVGLILLAMHAAGRAMEVLWSTKKLSVLFTDKLLRTWVLLTEVAVVGTLLNPYGVDMLIETATFGRNPNLKDILEWYPLKLIALEGIQFSVALLLLFFLVRHSRQRFAATDVLLLLAYAVMIIPTIRMIAWFAPVFVFVTAPHFGSILNKVFGEPEREKDEQPIVADYADGEPTPLPSEHAAFQFAGTLVALLLMFMAFVFSPISSDVVGGKSRNARHIYSKFTPHGVTEFLRTNPSNAMIFGPQWWGDWLAWDGPPGTKVFMTTHVHLAPKQVWTDYLRVARGQTGWPGVLDRYDVQMLVADKELQAPLIRQVRGMEAWQIVYEDKLAIVARRANPLSNKSEPKSAESPVEPAAETVTTEASASEPTPPVVNETQENNP